MDERARKILAEAWDNVERIDKMLANMAEREPYDAYAPKEWEPPVHRTRGLDTTPEQPAATNVAPDAAWNEWFDTRFNRNFEAHMAEYSETIVKLTFGRMDRHRKELQAEVAALRTELNLLREVRNSSNVTVMELKKA
jgi:hypothetical protein